MSDTALANTPQRSRKLTASSDTETKPEKKQRISKRLAEAVRLLTDGNCKTLKAASERTGMHYGHLCEALKKPHVRVFYERAARESIAAGVMRASARIMDLVDAGSEHVSFDAAKHILGIAGIKPASEAQVSVNIDIKAGYVIDLSEDGSTYRSGMSHTAPNEIKDITPKERS